MAWIGRGVLGSARRPRVQCWRRRDSPRRRRHRESLSECLLGPCWSDWIQHQRHRCLSSPTALPTHAALLPLLRDSICSTSNSKLSNCKAFGCTGSGFNIGGTRNMFSSCEAQDNGLYGFNDSGADNVFAACVADSNGQSGGTTYGFSLSGASAAVGCLTINRSGSSQDYGYISGVANGAYPSIVGCTSRLPGTAHVAPSSVGAISVNGLIGTQSVAYASSITPDPYLGGTVIVGTLTEHDHYQCCLLSGSVHRHGDRLPTHSRRKRARGHLRHAVQDSERHLYHGFRCHQYPFPL